MLQRLENGKAGNASVGMAEELPLFAQAELEPEAEPQISALEAALSEIDPDALTPREALEILYKIKGLAGRP